MKASFFWISLSWLCLSFAIFSSKRHLNWLWIANRSIWEANNSTAELFVFASHLQKISWSCTLWTTLFKRLLIVSCRNKICFKNRSKSWSFLKQIVSAPHTYIICFFFQCKAPLMKISKTICLYRIIVWLLFYWTYDRDFMQVFYLLILCAKLCW